MVQRASRSRHDDRENHRAEEEPRRNGGRLLNRSPALARHREALQQSRSSPRSSIADWSTSLDAPPSQLDEFDGAIGELHDAVAVGNHSVWGDPLPPRLRSAPVQMQRSSSATSSSAAASAPDRSTTDGGAASDNASYAAPPRAPTRGAPRACPEVNSNFERAVAHANLRNAIDDLFRLPPGGTGDQVAIRDEQGQSRILPRAAAMASLRRVEAELRGRIGHIEANIIGLRETLRALRANNQNATNPFDFPAAERQIAELERRLTEMRELLASRTSEAWARLPALLDAAGTSSSQINAFITENIIDDTPGAEVARAALRTVRNTSLAVFAAAAIAATGGLAGVALAGAAGATINVAEQASEVGHGLRQNISGTEAGAAALYAMLDAALQVLTGTSAASGLAGVVMQRAERMLLARGLSQELAQRGARWVAQQALSQVTSRLRQAGDAGIQRATGVSRSRPDDTSADSGMSRFARQPGTALRDRGTLPSWTPDAVIAKLDEYGLESALSSFAESRVESLRDQASSTDRSRMEGLSAKGAVSRAESSRASSTPVQMRRQRNTGTDIHAAAEEGLRGSRGALPFASQIQRSFGRHDISGVGAHVDGAAKKANTSMGSLAYATGNSVAFGQSPDLHTAAHEAAHIVQQRAGVHLSGGVGQSGDRYERHADAVAERVVQGRSAQDLLDEYAPASASSSAVQRRAVQMWSEQEHRAIGNRASEIVMPHEPGAVRVPVREGALSFGAAARSGGDYAADPDALNAQGARLEANERANDYRPTNTPGQALGQVLRGGSGAADFIGMASIGGTNVNHFYPLCQNEFRAHHAAALSKARAGNQGEAMREAGFAAHFLMDSFAAGHQAPRALDRIREEDIRATATPNPAHTEEGLGLLRSKPFHDALNALRDGIPLRGVSGRFHGDDTMTGREREEIAQQVAIALGEVLHALGLPGVAAPAGPVNVPNGPDGPAIMRDANQPMAQRIWRILTRTYETDLRSAERRPADASIDSRGHTRSNVRETAAAMRNAIYGDQSATEGHVIPREVPLPTGTDAAPRTTEALIAHNRGWHAQHDRPRPTPEPPRPAGVDTDASQ